MGGDRWNAAHLLQKLSRRERLIVFLTVLTVISAVLYQFPYMTLEKQTAAIGKSIDAAEKDIVKLSLEIAELKSREDEIRAAEKSNAKEWRLADPKGVILLLEDVTSEARRLGVNLVAVYPSREIDKDKYREISLNLDLKGRYRELARYFKHLEDQSRLVNVRKFRVEACPDSASSCATQVEAVAYVAK